MWMKYFGYRNFFQQIWNISVFPKKELSHQREVCTEQENSECSTWYLAWNKSNRKQYLLQKCYVPFDITTESCILWCSFHQAGRKAEVKSFSTDVNGSPATVWDQGQEFTPGFFFQVIYNYYLFLFDSFTVENQLCLFICCIGIYFCCLWMFEHMSQ